MTFPSTPSGRVIVVLLGCVLLSCSGDEDENALDLCGFFDDADNCYERLNVEALACVGTAFAQPGALSSDGLQCSSVDGQVTATFAQALTGKMDEMHDVTVKRADALCFRYRGAGSGSTPATFASASITLEMESDENSGDLVLRCEGKKFRGNLFKQCSGTKRIPSVGTSFFTGNEGKTITMSSPQSQGVSYFYNCSN